MMDEANERRLQNTILTMQLGLALSVMLALIFLSGGLFYLYVFNYDIGPYFTVTRVIHFYVGLASVPFLLAKYGSTGFRFAGYYLRVPRFKKAGPPAFIPRILSPLLALDFFVLYFSGAYILFHYYYTVTNIPPLMFKPVQLHLWAALIAVPLLAAHLVAHFVETLRGLSHERRALRVQGAPPELTRVVGSRRALIGAVVAGGLGLAFTFQDTPAVNAEVHGLFIGRIPRADRGGPGDFPIETLFGRSAVEVASWRLRLSGAVKQEMELSYSEILALPSVSATIRISCVSGWTSVPTWAGPRLRDVLALAGADANAQSIAFHSITKYGLTWHRHLLGDDALLATHVNGAPLSLDHGFPVRLIAPGYPGQNMVKQLDRIDVQMEAEPFQADFKLIQ